MSKASPRMKAVTSMLVWRILSAAILASEELMKIDGMEPVAKSLKFGSDETRAKMLNELLPDNYEEMTDERAKEIAQKVADINDAAGKEFDELLQNMSYDQMREAAWTADMMLAQLETVKATMQHAAHKYHPKEYHEYMKRQREEAEQQISEALGDLAKAFEEVGNRNEGKTTVLVPGSPSGLVS